MVSLKSVKVLSALVSVTLVASQTWAMAISEVAELQFHKVNQLAATHKIEAGFVDHLQSVSMQKDSASANYLITFAQEGDKGAMGPTVTIKADANAKPLAWTTAPGVASAQPVNWYGKSSLDILEKAVEYVVDTTTVAVLANYRDNFASATLAQVTTPQGPGAQILVRASNSTKTLVISSDLNGKILGVTEQ